MKSIKLLAPAKVNLFLRVLAKRPDGYHEIETLFEKIALFDGIEIERLGQPGGIEVFSDRPIVKRQSDNLAYKAAKAILEFARPNGGVRIHIKKRIPIAGGLGGGSSDAAAALKGIDKLFDLKLKKKVLIRFASGLGADVPFFLLDKTFAAGTKRGDELRAVRSKSRFWHVLVYPGFPLSTKEIYGRFDSALTRDSALTGSYSGVRMPSRKIPNEVGFESLNDMLSNDLEPVVIRKKRVIGEIIERLSRAAGRKAIISGSGPSVFCLFDTRKEAMRAKDTFLTSSSISEKRKWQIFLAQTL